MSHTTAALSTESMRTALVQDRVTAICAKMNDLERRVVLLSRATDSKPETMAFALATLANEIGRVRQFSWYLLKDIEKAQEAEAAAMPHQDAKP